MDGRACVGVIIREARPGSGRGIRGPLSGGPSLPLSAGLISKRNRGRNMWEKGLENGQKRCYDSDENNVKRSEK